MENKTAKAYLRYVRISPRKIQIVCDLIRGKDAGTAMAILAQTPKAASEPLTKLLKSAVANAENNFGMDPAKLVVSEVFATPGPILKRMMPRDQGRIRKGGDSLWDRKLIPMACGSASSKTGIPVGMPVKRRSAT